MKLANDVSFQEIGINREGYIWYKLQAILPVYISLKGKGITEILNMCIYASYPNTFVLF